MQTINTKVVATIEKDASPIVEEAKAIVIKSPKDMELATVMLSRLNQLNDRIKARREEATKPLNAALKSIRDLFKPLESNLEIGIGAVRKAMIEYQTAEKKRADEEAARIANRVGEGKGKLKVETAVKKIEEIDKPQDKVTTAAGLVKFKTVKKFEVIDKTKVPFDYLTADEVAIRKAMLGGTELPGVRYYEEEIPINVR
jgi:hypothetical protein